MLTTPETTTAEPPAGGVTAPSETVTVPEAESETGNAGGTKAEGSGAGHTGGTNGSGGGGLGGGIGGGG